MQSTKPNTYNYLKFNFDTRNEEHKETDDTY